MVLPAFARFLTCVPTARNERLRRVQRNRKCRWPYRLTYREWRELRYRSHSPRTRAVRCPYPNAVLRRPSSLPIANPDFS